MRDHTQRLAELHKLGWTCEHPQHKHSPVANDGTHHRSVYLEGLIHGVPQSIFLSIATGLVMVLKGDDYAFDMFVEYVDGKPSGVQVAKGQRGLFGDDE